MAIRISPIPRRNTSSVGHFFPLSSLISTASVWAGGSAATGELSS